VADEVTLVQSDELQMSRPRGVAIHGNVMAGHRLEQEWRSAGHPAARSMTRMNITTGTTGSPDDHGH